MGSSVPRTGVGRVELVALTHGELEWLMTPDAGESLTVADLFPGRPAWMADGLCRLYPEVEFVPPPQNPGTEAKAVCQAGCPVILDCLRFAVEHDEVGVWGGTTQQERRAARPRKAG